MTEEMQAEDAQISAPETEDQLNNDQPQESTGEGQQQDGGGEAPSGVQKRINQLTAEKYAERRRAEELERKMQELQAQKPESEPQAVPTLEDFAFDEEKYQAALVENRVQAAVQAQMEQFQQSQAQQQEAQRQQQVQAQYNQKVAEFAEQAPDFVDSVSVMPLQNDGALQAIMNAENGPAVAYHLSKRLDLVDQINNADPYTAAMMVGQINASVSQQPQAKAVTEAPDPIEPVAGGSMAISSDLEARTSKMKFE